MYTNNSQIKDYVSQKMVCHGAHTYVYSQVIVHILSQEPRGGAIMKRLSQEITRCAQQRLIEIFYFIEKSKTAHL